MTGLVGCSTATTRCNGNHSSRCKYKSGASARASLAPESVGASAPETEAGRGGIWARGPQAVSQPSTDVTKTRLKVLSLYCTWN